MKKILNKLKSFYKYYLLRKPKLVLTILLTIIIYIWINNIYNAYPIFNFKNLGDIVNEENMHNLENMLNFANLIFISEFFKPIFAYISGLIIINKI